MYDFEKEYKKECRYDILRMIKYLAIGIALWILISGIGNACTAGEWNKGKCPDCGVRYELRGATRYTNIYACPECGREVERMDW